MNAKEFMINNHKFVINYLDDLSKLELISDYNDYRVINVSFTPQVLMTLDEAVKIVNENENLILDEFITVIEENPEMYKHFDYELLLSGGGSSEFPENGNKYLIELEVRIPLRIKEGVN
ncbi:hypothetical protein [Flavobacterium capsici]|uniref:Uncharacterized protein n=1 Tax=Flavobacterium capsici TaxID=3075618 RepID=A0AA96F4K8_9FLAO|nr:MULTISPECIES: hypothetical protein [unclassified Flavobacterium]WNM18631.1 hypothetical protein RN608_11495 [Flavobacterium sp. PMR2A8]WNM22682.1 hypothetical protein RN605_04795 [Flavobacterium sp. PMTSA4]